MFARNFAKVLKEFHHDEDGMEAVQAVLIAGIGAIVLAVVVKKWPTIKSWFESSTNEVTNFKN